MVTRVDKKPIIYNTTFIRSIKPAVIASNKVVLDKVLKLAHGHRIPTVAPRDILEDFEDIEHAFKVFGIDDPAYNFFGYNLDDEDDEAIRIARLCIQKGKTMRQVMRSNALMEDICKVQRAVMKGVDRMYFGTEAVYQLFTRAVWGEVFEKPVVPNYAAWATDTTKRILVTQSPYLLIHPYAMREMAEGMGKDMDYRVWHAWDMFKKIETLSIRIGSRKNMLAHAYYSGINKRGFTPDKEIEKDFAMPLTGYCAVRDEVTMYVILGLRYISMSGHLYVLSHDDCINLATMAQCYFRTAMYFTQSNGYPGTTVDKALGLIKDIAAHACRLIDAKKNFSHIIRSMHILSQGEFNDAFEDEMGTELGWKERSINYRAEAHELDPMGAEFHKRATDLALDKTDRLNTCFIYHAFIGDEMIVDDLRSKVSGMAEKVMSADQSEWNMFIKFVKAYTLSRYMLINKKRPACGGNISLLNTRWAERCVAGMFTMPPQSEWGDVWIEGELKYTDFADTWHLEAQDVSYVVKDADGIVQGKYVADKLIHSELLMAMTNGNILDTKTGSTPKSARERICSGKEIKEVVLTTAPKAENAKPSWKKRVTFAADCEFRKMQAECDRNCRKVMSFVRGPSLGVDQCILEKQFADIADATATGLKGAICSHDISAWSESMDRGRKFEFEAILLKMFDKPEMVNIQNDWKNIKGIVNKQGCKDIFDIPNCSFQGFDGSASTILHSMILIYCIDSARRLKIIPVEVKTNMATLIDDCIALMVDLFKTDQAMAFWEHLKATYLKLGFEVDDLKSIFSTIKAIYLSRRFLLGGEVPSDLKVFIKAHSSYEDPLRCALDIPGDIFGAMRGASDANGEPWYVYFCSCVSSLAEIAHTNNKVMTIPASAAAIYALAPIVENGWGFPSIVSWATNDVVDKRVHFNAILENASVHACQSAEFQAGVDVYPLPVAKAVYSIKSQAWRMVSVSNIFTNPFEAIREGPLKPDMLRRNAVQDMLEEVAIAEPWKSLLKWNGSATTTRIREMLIQSGPLHAPTLAALVNCMPDNYRLSLIGKAVGSESLLGLLTNAQRVIIKRRVIKCSSSYFAYTAALYNSSNVSYTAEDVSSLTYVERSRMEREEFYTANGVNMIDHTFPDPVATFTVSSVVTNSVISPNLGSLRIWDKTRNTANRTNQFISDKGLYVPRKSGRVWEVTCEYAKGWDTVSQRVAMGLAILARAEADGHKVEGLLLYFIKSWNELSNITPKDTHLIAIHGSIKRLDANPGSSTHPIIVNRNILRGFNNKLKTALDAIPQECAKSTGSTAHLHDFLAHETAMTCVTALMFSLFQYVGKLSNSLSYQIATRQGCIIPECQDRMRTDKVANMINIEIMDGHDNYGLLQACPELVVEIALPTMKASWVQMINALIDRDLAKVEELRKTAAQTPVPELTAALEIEEVNYSPSIIIAAEPASRSSFSASELSRVTLSPTAESSRAVGDVYTMAVKTVGSKFTRTLSEHLPAHVMAATAVRSLVWSRLKTINAAALAKILYLDPDADYKLIERCGSSDFWRGAIVEVSRLCADKSLSEMSMSAFRSLGVPELHIMHSNDIKAVTHSVASYFGAHLKSVIVLISDLVTSLAGRSSFNYSKPLSEKIVTNNPSVLNAKLRKEHVKALIASNIEMYRERIEKLKSGEPDHRGDKRFDDSSRYKRVVELRCRMYTYMSVDVDDSGLAKLNEEKFGAVIHEAAKRVANRLELNEELVPGKADTFGDTLQFMYDFKQAILTHKNVARDGWDPDSGSLGARLALETISMDADMVMNTKFAVSASEVAPRLHKRVIVTPRHTPAPVLNAPMEFMSLGMGDDDDEENLLDLDDDELEAAFSSVTTTIPIPLWQALYALVLTGVYTSEDVDSKLGTHIGDKVTALAIREAHLEDFSDDEIIAAFHDIKKDYVLNGILFEPEWLSRDEADAYTTDEMNTVKGGFLF